MMANTVLGLCNFCIACVLWYIACGCPARGRAMHYWYIKSPDTHHHVSTQIPCYHTSTFVVAFNVRIVINWPVYPIICVSIL